MLFSERPAKILILGEADVPHSQRWAAHFRDRGCTTRWLSFEPVPKDTWAESLGGSRKLRALHVLCSVPQIRKVIAEFKPDIVSALYAPDYGWLAALAGAQPLALSVWGSDILIAPNKSALHRARIRHVLSRADCVFADAEFLCEKLRGLGAKEDSVAIIPLGVGPEWVRVGEQRTTELHSPPSVLINRRWEPLYRVDTSVEAAAELQKSAPGQFRFTVIGAGSEEGKLRKLAKQHALTDILQFHHWLPANHLRDQLGSHTVFVSTSSSDGTSVSLLEAMAAGCLPVVTDIPGNREWIEDRVNGRLFAVGNSAQLAKCIRECVSEPEWMRDVQKKNLELIQTKAMWQDNMLAVENMLIKTMKRFQEAQHKDRSR